MSRIPLIAPDGASHDGPSPPPSLYGHVPSIQRGARALDQGILEAGGVPQQLRRLMNVRVASMVGCPF